MNLDTALTALAGDPSAPLDLAHVCLLLAQDEYPFLDLEGYLSEVDVMAHEVRQQMKGRLPSRLACLIRYLFHDLGFHGNTEEYYDPRNSYLNEVLDRRLGLPITLSVVAMVVGRRAGLPIEGVGLPGHFIARAVEGDKERLFDPFHGGRILTREQCARLVLQTTGTPLPSGPGVFTAATPGDIVLRMLSNLKGVYLGSGEFERGVRIIERLCQLAPNDAVQKRDLGACLLRRPAGPGHRSLAGLPGRRSRCPRRGGRAALADRGPLLRGPVELTILFKSSKSARTLRFLSVSYWDSRCACLFGDSLVLFQVRGQTMHATIHQPHSASQVLRQSPHFALRRLSLEERDGMVIIQGAVVSYYLKQLAQETLRPLLAGRRLINEVRVIRELPFSSFAD